MKRFIDRIQDPLPRILLAPSRKKFEKANQDFRQRLQTITPTSVLQSLSAAFEPLLKDSLLSVDQIFVQYATQDPGHDRIWRKSDFVRYISVKLTHHELLEACTPVLWCMFCAAAYYPFSASELVPSRDNSYYGQAVTLDREAFRRAYAILVLRGWELFGPVRNGDQSKPYRLEKTYSAKVPRLAEAVFQCLAVPSAKDQPEPEKQRETLRFNSIRRTLAFVQPEPPEAVNILGATFRSLDFSEDLDCAAQRLAQATEGRSQTTQSHASAVGRTDLRQLLRLLLLVRLDDLQCTNAGPRQQTGDVHCAQFDLNQEEIIQASQYAEELLTSQFGAGEQSVKLDAFTKWVVDVPYVVLSFFQLWAAFFMNSQSRSARYDAKLHLPTSIVNILCFGNSAFFLDTDSPFLRWHQNEVSFHTSLQNAKLVASVAPHSGGSISELHTMLTAKEQGLSVLIIHGIDDDAARNEHKRTLVVLVDNSPKSPTRIESNEESRPTKYVWRTSVAQIQPSIILRHCGGSGVRPIEKEVLELFSHGVVDGQGTTVTLDAEGKSVVVRGLERISTTSRSSTSNASKYGVEVSQPAQAASTHTFQMSLLDLQCYHMPGTRTTWQPKKPFELPWGTMIGED